MKLAYLFGAASMSVCLTFAGCADGAADASPTPPSTPAPACDCASTPLEIRAEPPDAIRSARLTGPTGKVRLTNLPFSESLPLGNWNIEGFSVDGARFGNVERTVELRQGRPVEVELASRPMGTLLVVGPDGTKGTVSVDDCHRREVSSNVPIVLPAGRAWLDVELGDGDYFRGPVEVAQHVTTKVEIPDGPCASFLIDGREIPVSRGVQIERFDQSGAFDAYSKRGEVLKKFKREPFEPRLIGGDVREAEEAVDAVVMHMTVTPDLATAWRELSALGLSTHFMIGRDGSIHQPLDLRDAALHADEENPRTVSIDLDHPGTNLRKNPDAPDANAGVSNPAHRYGPPRDFQINGGSLRTVGGTPAMQRSSEVLLVALARTFPKLRGRFPQDSEGAVIRHKLDNPAFAGVIAHWHLVPHRWDPGAALDWASLEKSLRAACVWDKSPR